MRKRKRVRKKLIDSGTSQKSSQKLFSFNSKVIFLFLMLLALGVTAQMFRWQVLESEKFRKLAKTQYTDTQRQSSGRGNIYAADSTILATDKPTWDVYASLSSIEDERDDFFKEKEAYLEKVSGILGLKKEELDKKLSKDFRYVSLKKGVDTNTKQALESEQIFTERAPGFGLHFGKSEKRYYPNGSLAAHTLGYMGKNDMGQDRGFYGIEGYYFSDLLGTEGFTYEEQDAYGNVILTSEYEPVLPREGKDIVLTIEPGIQEEVENALKKGVETHQAKSGTAIVMNPNTGAIIAMANYPSYNPNEYWRTQDGWIFKNKAVGDVYEPGSVFKPITVSIGLETEAITEDTVCNDATGYLTFYEGTPDEKTIYTWDKQPDGKISPEQYLQYSNNPCIAKTALAVGHKKYYPMIKEFGIGKFIGLGLQDETNSYLAPYERWTELDLAVTSFGQSISTTPMQITSAISTIANEGKRMRPYVVKEVIDDNEPIPNQPTVEAQPISEETADKVAEMMVSVVRGGDAKWIFEEHLTDYSIAGKTGTAQIPKKDSTGYYADRTNATFIGFSPVKDAKMIMLVRLEEPGLNEYAATTAVPVWADIFLDIADDLEIPKK
jgi:cell division protein FtsI/penicillin-binding protein 2